MQERPEAMTSKGIVKKSVHSSLLSWALANDNNLSSSLFLDKEPQKQQMGKK